MGPLGVSHVHQPMDVAPGQSNVPQSNVPPPLLRLFSNFPSQSACSAPGLRGALLHRGKPQLRALLFAIRLLVLCLALTFFRVGIWNSAPSWATPTQSTGCWVLPIMRSQIWQLAISRSYFPFLPLCGAVRGLVRLESRSPHKSYIISGLVLFHGLRVASIGLGGWGEGSEAFAKPPNSLPSHHRFEATRSR